MARRMRGAWADKEGASSTGGASGTFASAAATCKSSNFELNFAEYIPPCFWVKGIPLFLYYSGEFTLYYFNIIMAIIKFGPTSHLISVPKVLVEPQKSDSKILY